jgi:hypothetical protein
MNTFKRLYVLFFVIVVILVFISYNFSPPSFLQLKITSNHNILFKEKVSRTRYSVDCTALFENSKQEQAHAFSLLDQLQKHNATILPDSNFIFDEDMCNDFKTIRGYNEYKVTKLEEEFPLGFIILMNEKVEQFERLLRLIYRPQNVYCIHIDSSSSDDIKQAVKSIINCFDNVFLATKLENVVWGGFTLLKADLNCMENLLNADSYISEKKHPNFDNKRVAKWKYVLNAASSFLPLRTNYELVRILGMYNGANDIGVNKNSDFDHRFIYQTILNFTGKQAIQTDRLKDPPPHNFTILMGSNYIACTRSFVDYVINNKKSHDLISWSQDMLIPDEM